MKKVLITGITGYIGGTIAKKLLDRNYEVTGLVRNEAHVQELESLGIKTIIGNIHNEDLIKTAVEKIDIDVPNWTFVAARLFLYDLYHIPVLFKYSYQQLLIRIRS